MKHTLAYMQHLAREAGAIMLRHWQGRYDIYRKPDQTLVTSVDLQISEFVQRETRLQAPGCALLTEESHQHGFVPRECGFIVDELDGTHAFAAHLPGFSFQCAYYEAYSRLEIGLIYDPLRDLMLYGIRGEGAWMLQQGRPRRLHARTQVSWDRLRFAHHRSHMSRTQRQVYDRLGVAPDRIVPTGSIGSKGIAFAADEVDALVSLHPHVGPWDWAPGKVILEEIGFRVSHLNGQPLSLGGADLASGYLVCPSEHEARFVQGLGWLQDRLRRRSRSALLLAA